MSKDFQEGEIISIDKPLYWTSFRVVRTVRNALSHLLGVTKIKVGHAGTLDPLATGVMILCTGKKTKEIEKFQYQTKEYTATLRLGATTPSFDLETEVDHYYPTSHITEQAISAVLKQFVGEIEQVPPQYSACKVDGRRAYDIARKGDQVELKPKKLVIEKIELISASRFPEIDLHIVCSKGTYIRALARDIGTRLNSGAHLTALRRVRVGDITEQHCLSIQQLLEELKMELPEYAESLHVSLTASQLPTKKR